MISRIRQSGVWLVISASSALLLTPRYSRSPRTRGCHPGVTTHDALGASVNGIGDFDGDGIGDFAIERSTS